MVFISIIVPVYNAEEYLERCLTSIVNQTYKKIEIIIVNDGSTDNSREICEKFENKYSNIKVINKENGGQSSARNIGISFANGQYIAFVDSDDWIETDIYEHCIRVFNRTNCDVVDFKVKLTSEYAHYSKSDNYSIQILEGKEILRNYLYKGQTEKAPFSPCRKVFKRELFQGVKFPEGKVNEDIVTIYKTLMKSKKIVCIEKIGYYYFQSSLSTTRNGFKRRDFDLLDASKELQILTKDEKYKDIEYLAKLKLARSYFSLLAKIAFYGFENEFEIVEKKKIIKSLTNNLRANYKFLIKSPIMFNRKLMITLLCINYKCLSIPLNIYKKLTKKI